MRSNWDPEATQIRRQLNRSCNCLWKANETLKSTQLNCLTNMNNSTSEEMNTTTRKLDLMAMNVHLRNTMYSMFVINAVSSLLASVFNFVIILAFVKKKSLRTPSYVLILSLAISDLGVGVVMQPAYCFKLIAGLTNNRRSWNEIIIFSATLLPLVSASLLTITSITIDRFLAVHLRLRYQTLVTTKRSCIVVVMIWIVSMLNFVNLSWYSTVLKVLLFSVVLLNIVLMVLISRAIKRYSAQIQAQQQPAQPTMNMQRYKKSVKTMYYIMVTFVVCYCPILFLRIIKVAMKQAGIVEWPRIVARDFTNILFMMNSALNPVIYCWRIQEIRNAVLQLLRRQWP